MRLDLFDDTGTDEAFSGQGKRQWLKARLLGDPRKAPRRLIGLGVFAIILMIVIGLLYLIQSTAATSGSSLWLLRIISDIVGTLWFAIPVALIVYYKFLGRRRNRNAAAAANQIGWLRDSVKTLSDEVRSTDNTNRLIVTTDDDYETIREAVDMALRSESHPLESVDYYGRGLGEDGESASTDADEAAAEQPELDDGEKLALPGRVAERGGRQANEQPPPEDSVVNAAPASERPDADDATYRERAKSKMQDLGQRVADVSLTTLESIWRGVTATLSFLVAVPLRLIARLPGRSTDPPESETPEKESTVNEGVPWRIRFAEELKHFLLDFTAGYRSDDIRWRFIFPTVATMATLLLAFRLWVRPVAYLIFLGVSVLVGLSVFYVTKRLRSRRIRSYQRDVSGEYWDDVGALVKTVETADVTAYVGFMAGRSYATYDREEFLREFSLRLWQHTHDERVSPSILEQYARNLAMMKPNLKGHRENVEVPAILRRIKQVVMETEDEVVEKAELAFRVIEPTDESYKFERELGHDPRLVASQYRWLVEQGKVLSEFEMSMPNAQGDETDVTLVYPSEKNRLPDVQEVHSRLSERFHGLQGEPYYKLPSVDAQIHIEPFQATASTWEELPEEGPNGKTVTQ